MAPWKSPMEKALAPSTPPAMNRPTDMSLGVAPWRRVLKALSAAAMHSADVFGMPWPEALTG